MAANDPHDHDHGHDHAHGHYHPPEGEGPLRFSDPAQESLSQALRAGFNVLRVIMIVLLVAYFASGWFQVPPGDQGLIVRLGKLRDNDRAGSPYAGTPVFGPGWHFALPDPLDEKLLLPGQSRYMYIDSFLVSRDRGEHGKPLGVKTLSELVAGRNPQLTPGADGFMISGDRNISHGFFAVEYRIVDAARFVRSIGDEPADLEPVLRPLAENAVLRAVAGRRVEEVLKFGAAGDSGSNVVAEDIRSRLQAELDRLEAGVSVVKVAADTIEPGPVRMAFVNVSNAENERQKLIKEAEQQRDQILGGTVGSRERYQKLLATIEELGAAQATGADEPRIAELRMRIDAQLEQAQGEVAAVLGRAQTRATAQLETMRRQFEEFQFYRDAHRKNPELTVVRLWVRMRDAVLGSKQNEIFYVPQSGVIEILANRDPQRLIDAEKERYKGRFGQPP